MGTVAPAVTPHMLSLPKNLRPQFTVVWVVITTFSMAADTCAHFEFAPQPPVQVLSLLSSFIESDLSWTIRTSGGSICNGVFDWPQVGAPPIPPRIPMSPPPPPCRGPPVPPAAMPEVPAAPAFAPAPPLPVVVPVGVPAEKLHPHSPQPASATTKNETLPRRPM